jgi:alpha-galactosidase
MNRAFSEPGYEVKTDKDIWLEYVKGLYMIMDYLKGKYSEVEIESCSGGGGRIDLAVMERIEQFWTSDNTDPFDRLFIQQGYSYAYAPRAMMCWVTDAPNFLNGRKCTLEYRFNSAMQGSLGIGMNLNKLSNEEIEESRRLIEKYKGIREIIQNGRLVRLHGRENGEIFANQYVSEDDKKVIVFVFIRAKNFGIGVKLIKLAGLKEEERYINKETGIKMSGKALMEIGLRVEADGDYYSKTIELEID